MSLKIPNKWAINPCILNNEQVETESLSKKSSWITTSSRISKWLSNISEIQTWKGEHRDLPDGPVVKIPMLLLLRARGLIRRKKKKKKKVEINKWL